MRGKEVIMMPRMDGTGPMGMGAATGRGLGICTGAYTNRANYVRRGRGLGMGFRRFAGRGLGRGFKEGFGFTGAVNDKSFLKNQASALRAQLSAVEKQLSDIDTDR